MNLIVVLVITAYLAAGIWLGARIASAYGLGPWVALGIGLALSFVMFGITSLLLKVLIPERQREGESV